MPGAAKVSEKIQPGEIMKGRGQHQPHDQNHPKPKSKLLGPLAKRTPQNRFASIVQKMPAVEQGNRKKVGKPNAYGKYSRQIEKRQKAHLGDLVGHIHDPHRAPDLVGTGMALDHLDRRPPGVSWMMSPVWTQAAPKRAPGRIGSA